MIETICRVPRIARLLVDVIPLYSLFSCCFVCLSSFFSLFDEDANVIRLENIGLGSYSDDSRCSFVMDYWDNWHTDWLSSSILLVAWFLPGSLYIPLLCCLPPSFLYYIEENQWAALMLTKILSDSSLLMLKFILIHVHGNFHFLT
jgi:hypothetical protein